MDMTRSTLQIKFNVPDFNLVRKMTGLCRDILACEVVDFSDSRKSDLLVMQLGRNAEADLESALGAIQKGAAEHLFLVAETADPKILLQAMRNGVMEFLTLPLDLSEFRAAMLRLQERKAQAGRTLESRSGNIISVFGSKGGVGTTTVAVNLAVSLAQASSQGNVALLDMNTLFGEIPLFLEIAPKFHWGEITKNIERLDNNFLQNILSKHKSGVNVLPSPAYLNGHVRPTPQIMMRLLGLMKQMFDYIIIDAGQSTDDTSIKVLEISDRLMLVTILSLPCLANTSKLIKSLIDLGYAPKEKIDVVLNRYIKKSEISVEDAEAGIGKEIFWIVPNDYSTSMSSINSGKPLAQLAPKAPITKSFLELAAQLRSPESDKPKKRWSLFS
jgi:pilus assembly protein CpaE